MSRLFNRHTCKHTHSQTHTHIHQHTQTLSHTCRHIYADVVTDHDSLTWSVMWQGVKWNRHVARCQMKPHQRAQERGCALGIWLGGRAAGGCHMSCDVECFWLDTRWCCLASLDAHVGVALLVHTGSRSCGVAELQSWCTRRCCFLNDPRVHS